MPAPALVAVHGAPGSAKRDFLRRVGSLLTDPRSLDLQPGRELYPDLICLMRGRTPSKEMCWLDSFRGWRGVVQVVPRCRNVLAM